jgi:hypothetical protein
MPKITTKPSEIRPGRICFYIDGEYRGSATTKADAIKSAKELVALAKKNAKGKGK